MSPALPADLCSRPCLFEYPNAMPLSAAGTLECQMVVGATPYSAPALGAGISVGGQAQPFPAAGFSQAARVQRAHQCLAPRTLGMSRSHVIAERKISRQEMASSGHLVECGVGTTMPIQVLDRTAVPGCAPRAGAGGRPPALASTRVPPEDGPGPYVILHHEALVSPTAARSSEAAVIGKLPAGVFVHVLEVLHLPESGRLRGRIEHPSGWISLLDMETGYRWAEPYERVLAGDPGRCGVSVPKLWPPLAPALHESCGAPAPLSHQPTDPHDRDVLYC